MDILVQCCVASLLVAVATGNLQAWSEQTYLNKPHTLSCNITNGNISVNVGDTLSWTRLGSEAQLETGEYYQLLNDSDITNMFLEIKSVTSEMTGIYFCTVHDTNGEYVGRKVTGLNIAGHLYDDKFEEYRTDVIRGVICAAAVLAFVVGIGLIDRFRYLSDEQKQKRKDRKQDRLNRLQTSQNGGVDNLAMTDDLQLVERNNGSPSGALNTKTHL